MFRKIFTLIILVFCVFTLSAQTPYGNDWINFNQKYFKIKVASTGIFRLDFNQLNQKIANLNSVDPRNFQLYKNGKEVAIYIQGENDGKFDTSDFIEFFGQKNDGTLDVDLYTSPTSQPHQYYSLFTDTASYFLTYTTGTAGKRIQNFQASKTGLVAEPFLLTEGLGVYPEAYYPGRYIFAHMSLSDYQEGEGFLGSIYGKGQSQTRILNTPHVYIGLGAPQIRLETYVAGRSDAASPHPKRYNHHLRVSVSNGNNNVIKIDTSFKSYEVIKTSTSITASELGQNTSIIFQSVDDLNLSASATDYQAVGYVKINYPRQTNLQNTADLSFSLKGNAQNRYIQFTDNNKNNPIIYDLISNQRIVGKINGPNAELVLSANTNDRNFYLYDSVAFVSAALENVNFVNLSPNSFNNDFLIVTHKKLSQSAQNYSTYRQQSGYKPYVITTEQIYDQFYYGIHHPLAIKNYVKYLLQFATTKPKYLLLLGKGLENNLIRNANGLADDMVPTFGSPPSDDLLTARINNNDLAPALATGRVGASSNEEVEIYLQKLKKYESYSNGLWRKNLIHISGGSNLSENLSWANYQTNMFNQAKNEPFGADTTNFTKNVTLPVASNQKQRIIEAINQGATLLAFLGHGSHQATEIDFGIPQELDNADHLLTYLVNGCTTGNTYVYAPSLGDKHMFFPEKGAVGWIGTSSEGVASYLSNFSTIFYQKVFTSNYGVSVAEALKLAKTQFQNPSDVTNVMHTTQYTFQGDPAMKFYSPEKPDYEIRDQDLYISPNNVTALNTSFTVKIITKNLGKAINKNLKVRLVRTLPNNTVINYPNITHNQAVLNRDTISFEINGNEISSAGMNKFQITLDPDNEVDEITKTNNTATLNFYFSANGINLLFPKQFAIESKNTVDLLAQSNDLRAKDVSYIFEIDTVKTFDSPWKKTNTIVAGFMPKWQVSLLSDNNRVYYWRARLNLDPDKGGIWQERSFTYIQDSPDGWNQSHYQQYTDGTFSSLEINPDTHKLEFGKTAFYTVVQTRGDDGPLTEERRYRSNPGGALGFRWDGFVGFTILALNPTTMRALNYPSQFNFQNQDDVNLPLYYSGQYYFDTNKPAEVDSLVQYINSIPNGYYVVGYNGYGINLSALPQNAKNAFQQVGVSQIGNIGAGEPYMFWGRKGAAPGTAIEKKADPSDPAPLRAQVIRFDKTYPYPLTQGNYTTSAAGPATKWKSASYEVNLEQGDQISYELIGYRPDGSSQTLQTLSGNTIDLSGYNAASFPKMAIKAKFTDGSNRTPSQMKKWKFLFDGLPEATINPSIADNFYKDKIQEGDSVKWSIAYQNVSKYPSDSVKVIYTLTKPDRSVVSAQAGKIAQLSTDANQTFQLKLPTLGLVGNNLLKLDFVPINGLDSYSHNNFIQQSFSVIQDKQEPMVDVAFDGKHIMNGEIVSPQPNINIDLSDNNPFILLTDTSAVTVYLKDENSNFKRIAYSSGLLNFMPGTAANNNKASVLFKPEKLIDGRYTLKVEAKDKTGNKNPNQDYTIDFEVVNESAVSNFYPYPNPFSTAMKFVFTLTGSKVPDKIKIQIMTTSGKIVREVFKNELGTLRIGNNISDFTWDGTDTYGDKLANGVYFYQVIIENDDKSAINHRKTNGDKYFKKNIGKIYLMR